MRIGQLHAAALTGEGLSRITPEVQSLQLPMMVNSYEELNFIREGMSGDLNALLDAKGFKVLTWADAGWVHFFSQEPIVHPPRCDLGGSGNPIFLPIVLFYQGWKFWKFRKKIEVSYFD